MTSLLVGVALLFATFVVFRACLPRNGKVARFVGTEWEPYIAVAFTTLAIMGMGFVVLGLVEVLALV